MSSSSLSLWTRDGCQEVPIQGKSLFLPPSLHIWVCWMVGFILGTFITPQLKLNEITLQYCSMFWEGEGLQTPRIPIVLAWQRRGIMVHTARLTSHLAWQRRGIMVHTARLTSHLAWQRRGIMVHSDSEEDSSFRRAENEDNGSIR